MDTRTRILTIRLAERISRAPKLSKELGITDKSKMKKTGGYEYGKR